MQLLRLGMEIILFILIVRVFADFIPPLGASGFGQGLIRLTDPVLAPIQRLLPRIDFGDTKIDVSALVVALLLNLVMNLIS